MKELNERQKEAAEFMEGICAVISVPGSGKTLSMMARIGNLVKEGIAPENIIGLTFTRNAAEEMRSRLIPVLEDKAERVMLSTIHSFCLYLLKRENRNFEIIQGRDQIILIRDIMKNLKVKDISIGMVLSEMSLAKNNLISVEEFKEIYNDDLTMKQIAQIAETYESEKKNRLFLDFDDLLYETWKMLTEDSSLLENYRSMFKHLLIDEFQDVNPLQMEIIKLLAGDVNNGTSLWITGDDSQSIFSFTGATVSNIVGFQDTFPNSKLIILNLNYRSTPQIVNACANLIKHNVRKIDKHLETHNKNGDDVIIIEADSEEDEASQIVTEILDLTSRGFAYKDIAVLYRANFQSRVIEECFSQSKVPYHIENGMNFYRRREVKILLDYLKVINNPDSDNGDEALENILNVPNRYVSRKFLSELKEYALEKEQHLYKYLKTMRIDLPYIRKNIKDFISFMDPLIKDAKTLNPSETIKLLRESLDYDKIITDESIPSPDDVKIKNLDQLQRASAKYNDIAAFLEYTENFQDESVNDKDGVSLMTIHKSKGMEFPVVILVGNVTGILPTKRGDLEEERRICFVAISRAMKILYLCWSKSYLGQPSEKSIFIDEILDNSCIK